jgi:ribA/ribD-fused uncharacterized protein
MNGFRDELWFLSNFYPTPVQMCGYRFATLEHAFQASKSTDPWEWRPFLDPLCTPTEAKRQGRALELRPDWEAVKYRIMCRLLASKFTMSTYLGDLLIWSTPPELVEINTWHDQEWGDCVCPRHAGEPGQNLLGHALMQLRTYLAGDLR